MTGGQPGPPPTRRSGWAVEARGLRKTFDSTVAVAGIDLLVPAGSFFGLVGPNGAGKSTTMRMCSSLLRPDSGTVTVAGVDVWSALLDARRVLGVLPDELGIFDRLTAPELLSYLGLLRRMPAADIELRTGELVAVMGLADSSDVLIADYSTGMRKKVALAAALLHDPAVMFLDEPFESVDPLSVRLICEVLDHYRRAGGTVVLSSHVMDTVQRLCTHVAIVNAGRVVAAGSVDEVCAGRRLDDVFVEAVGGTRTAAASLGWLGHHARIG